jgi:hypothetical protein
MILVKSFLASARYLKVFHWTDTRNLPSIGQHGLLSLVELAERGISPPAAGGNLISKQLDASSGLDSYVHLCLSDQHPMEYVARQEGRVLEVRYIQIDKSVLERDGVLFCNDVANKSGVSPIAIDEAITGEDLPFMGRWNDYRDPAVQAKLKRAKRFEILVPNVIEVAKLKNHK